MAPTLCPEVKMLRLMDRKLEATRTAGVVLLPQVQPAGVVLLPQTHGRTSLGKVKRLIQAAHWFVCSSRLEDGSRARFGEDGWWQSQVQGGWRWS